MIRLLITVLLLALVACDTQDKANDGGQASGTPDQTVSQNPSQLVHSADSERTNDPDNLDSEELPDGTYNCEATNTTQSDGPYSLECDKNGESLTIHFPNAGFIVTDIDSIQNDGSGQWTLETTHSDKQDNWEVEIDE